MASAKHVATPLPAKRAARTIAGTGPVQEDSVRAEALKKYVAAIELLQLGDYAKAHIAFDKLLETAPSELADRIRMYINACVLQISQGTTTFTSHEEQYDYAISLLNNGHYADAKAHFDEILAAHPSADFAFYGLAVLASMTGDSHECLDHLTTAIKHNPRNRIQARSDSDFQDMADDPRFTELLYPEV
jgi:tetratricopeptide (TPR) repeat protein